MAEGTPDIQALTARMLEQEAAGDLAGAAGTLVGMFEWPGELRVSTSDAGMRRALWEANDRRCFYTGREIALEDMAVDHILPRRLGGPDHFWNYAPTTPGLNSRKGTGFSSRHTAMSLHLNRMAVLKNVVWTRPLPDLEARARRREELAHAKAARIAALPEPGLHDLMGAAAFFDPTRSGRPFDAFGLKAFARKHPARRLLGTGGMAPEHRHSEIYSGIRQQHRVSRQDVAKCLGSQTFLHYATRKPEVVLRGADITLSEPKGGRPASRLLSDEMSELVEFVNSEAKSEGSGYVFKLQKVARPVQEVVWEPRVRLIVAVERNAEARLPLGSMEFQVASVPWDYGEAEVAELPRWHWEMPCRVRAFPLEAAYVSRCLEVLRAVMADRIGVMEKQVCDAAILRKLCNRGPAALEDAFAADLSRGNNAAELLHDWPLWWVRRTTTRGAPAFFSPPSYTRLQTVRSVTQLGQVDLKRQVLEMAQEAVRHAGCLVHGRAPDFATPEAGALPAARI